MPFTRIELVGYRGFGKSQSLDLAVPNGKDGSGLTVIVGPNNSGKSTIFESFLAISQGQPPSFTEGRRNKRASDKISITLYKDATSYIRLETVSVGGSETEKTKVNMEPSEVKIMTLPSRRTFQPFFGKGSHTRDQHISSIQLNSTRGEQFNIFSHRLFNIQKSSEQIEKFNKVLSRVMDPLPMWNIDQSDNGNHYIKFNYNGNFHNSDGAGEGLLSLFTIVDAFYDSEPTDVIVIDEPELSLHPSFQKKLIELILEYSKDRQVVISTHSPYFISWLSISNGGKIARTSKDAFGDIIINQLSDESVRNISGLLANLNNPHILGLDAREIFFLEERVVLVEGQEDVVFFKKILRLIEKDISGSFYGWGAGGATNIPKILRLISDLGFKKCAIILDANMSHIDAEIKRNFPTFVSRMIPTDDIRDKDAVLEKAAVIGLIDRGGKNLKAQYRTEIDLLIDTVNRYLSE